MKKILAVLAMLAAASAQATIYTDSTTDLHNGTPSGDNFSSFSHLNFDQVEISNDATTIYFAISVVQNPITSPTDWGNYMIGLDTTAGGDTAMGNNNTNDLANGNGWDRPINMPAGMDYWIGSWVNGGGGAQLWAYTGSWNISGTATPTVGTDLLIQVSLAALGLNIGDTFTFDVYSSGGGGGDSAVDALSVGTPAITTWGGPFSTTSPLSYTVVPEPSTMALIAIAGGLLAARRMRRS